MLDVLTIGTATRDVFLHSPYFRVLRDPEHLKKIGFIEDEAQCFALGAKIDIAEPFFTIGGGATNAAVTFARQGLKASALISLGKDAHAEAVIESLKQERVTPLVSVSKRTTAYSTLLLSKGGERTVLVARGAADDLRPTPQLLKGLKPQWVYITPGAIPVGVIGRLISHFAGLGAHIAMNPSGHYVRMGLSRLQPLFKKVHVLLLNRSEASQLTGANYQNERMIFKRFDNLFGGIAVMTDGPNGSYVSDGKTMLHAGIFKEKQIIDRTGAGDAFGSGFVAGLIMSASQVKPGERYGQQALESALKLASANATSVVEYIGPQAGILKKGAIARDSRFKHLVIRKTIV